MRCANNIKNKLGQNGKYRPPAQVCPMFQLICLICRESYKSSFRIEMPS